MFFTGSKQQHGPLCFHVPRRPGRQLVQGGRMSARDLAAVVGAERQRATLRARRRLPRPRAERRAGLDRYTAVTRRVRLDRDVVLAVHQTPARRRAERVRRLWLPPRPSAGGTRAPRRRVGLVVWLRGGAGGSGAAQRTTADQPLLVGHVQASALHDVRSRHTAVTYDVGAVTQPLQTDEPRGAGMFRDGWDWRRRGGVGWGCAGPNWCRRGWCRRRWCRRRWCREGEAG